MAEARRRLGEIYDRSSEAYVDSLSEGVDVRASKAIVALLTYARATQDYRVSVNFVRQNDIPTNIEQILRLRYGPIHIVPLDSAFAEDSMRSREQGIIKAISSAFSEVIPDDVLQFTESRANQNGPRFHVQYRIRAGESFYYKNSDVNVPEEARPFYPGILIDWQFEVSIPIADEKFKFALATRPAESFSYRHSGSFDEHSSIYDSMSESAFEDFRAELVKRFGLRLQQPVVGGKSEPGQVMSY